ncbi:Ubiquitin-conjugating enzyme E2 11 [Hanseniaspora osmophila]|uniref:Ubiquitin-conjugating enzyme E2 n=1 Tax=Hanseniaspora osmophila TaxID=56408 RepID=A0A1E5RFH0_9ASCO|nr:Ubiquitin-conjugating enzyme E2 [Hanseniaspora osmophila]
MSQNQRDQQNVTQRLQTELVQMMTKGTPPGLSAFPIDEEDITQWSGIITGPEGTPYEGLKFKILFKFPVQYPFVPPKVTFKSPMWHPNVDMSGNICLDILKTQWSAVYNVQTILLSLQALLEEPNNSSPLNAVAAELWDTNMVEYKKKLMARYEEFDDDDEDDDDDDDDDDED